MRNFRFKCNNSATDAVTGYVQTGNQACLMVAKRAMYFEYQFDLADVYVLEGLTQTQTIAFAITLVEEFIQEFGLQIDFKYVENERKFVFFYKEPKTGNNYQHLYACLIVSRWFVSGDTSYQRLFRNIYTLKQRGYTMFESYVIAACDGERGYYSFSDTALFDLAEYRKIKNKASIISGTSNMNNTVFRKLCGTFVPVTRGAQDLVEYYESQMKASKSAFTKFIKINTELVPAYTHEIRAGDRYLWMQLSNNRGLKKLAEWRYLEESTCTKEELKTFGIKLMGNVDLGYNHYLRCELYVNNSNKALFSLVDGQTFIKDNADRIREVLSKDQTRLLKRRYALNLEKLFNSKGLDLTDEINQSKILEKPIRSNGANN